MDTLTVLLMSTTNGRNATSFLQEKFHKFKKKEKIEIKTKFVSWNRAYGDIVKAFKEGDPPDILQLGTTWIRTMAHLGYIRKVSPNINIQRSLTNWLEEYCIYQGEKVAIPWMIDTVIMAARHDILSMLGINPEDTRNWDGFYKICRKIATLRERDKSIPKPLALAVRPEMDTVHRFSAWYFAQGYKYTNLESVPDNVLARENFLEIFKYISQLIQVCKINYNDVDKHPYQLNDDFYRHGLYVFYIGNWYGVVEDLLKKPTNDTNEKYIVLPIPSTNDHVSTCGGGSVLAVSSRTPHPEKAWRLVELMVNNDFLNQWLDFTVGVPAYDIDFWKSRFSNERICTMYDLSVKSNTYPIHPAWTSIENLLRIGISNCLWKLIENPYNKCESEILRILEKTDQSIKDVLEMCWELK